MRVLWSIIALGGAGIAACLVYIGLYFVGVR
jgi:hypothetical protein